MMISVLSDPTYSGLVKRHLRAVQADCVISKLKQKSITDFFTNNRYVLPSQSCSDRWSVTDDCGLLKMNNMIEKRLSLVLTSIVDGTRLYWKPG